MRQRQRHRQTTDSSATRGRGIANQEALAMENKMQRCRRMRGGGMTRGSGGSRQEVTA